MDSSGTSKWRHAPVGVSSRLVGRLASSPTARAECLSAESLNSRVSLCTSCSLAMLLNASVALRKGSEVVATFAGDGPTSNLSA